MKDKNQMMMMREGKRRLDVSQSSFLSIDDANGNQIFFSFFFSGSYRREKNLIMMQLGLVRCILS
jgi:hypothetical protein